MLLNRGPPNLAAALSLRVNPMQLASLVKRLISAPVLVAVVALSGCAHTLRHDVTVFHDWPGAGLARTYRFERKPDQQDSLKYSTYERVIADELRAAGFVPSENPNLAISFDYVTKPRYVRYIDNGPMFTPYLGYGVGGRRSSFYFSAPPLLMRAILADFPGRSGVARQIDLDLDAQEAPAPAK